MTVATVRPFLDLEEATAALPFGLAALSLDVVTSPSIVEAEWRSLEILPRNSLNQSYDRSADEP